MRILHTRLRSLLRWSFTLKSDSFLPAPRSSEFLLQPPDKHFPLLTTCHLFPYTTSLQERKARTDIPFAFTPFALARAKKKKKRAREKKNNPAHTHARAHVHIHTYHRSHVRRHAWRSHISVAGCDMFLWSMLMCESACLQASKIAC